MALNAWTLLAVVGVVVLALCIVGAHGHLKTCLEVAKPDRSLTSAGKASAQNQLRTELFQIVHQFKLMDEPNAHIPRRWREAFQILCSEKIEATRFNEERARAELTALGFGVDQAESLVDWRQRQPHTLVTVMLAVFTGQPDDDIWMLGAKGSLV